MAEICKSIFAKRKSRSRWSVPRFFETDARHAKPTRRREITSGRTRDANKQHANPLRKYNGCRDFAPTSMPHQKKGPSWDPRRTNVHSYFCLLKNKGSWLTNLRNTITRPRPKHKPFLSTLARMIPAKDISAN